MTSATDTPLAAVREHLEFLGYSTAGPEKDGWYRVEHPRRWNLHLLPTPIGLRLHCTVYLGASVPLRKAEWHEFLNRFNEEATVARATFAQDRDGDWFLRVRALLPPTYERRLFGALMDAWHDDLEYVAHAPSAQAPTAPLDADDETVN